MSTQYTNEEIVRIGNLVHRATMLVVNKGYSSDHSVTILPNRDPEKIVVKLVAQEGDYEFTISNALWICALVPAMKS